MEGEGECADIHTVGRQCKSDDLITEPAPSARRKVSREDSEGRGNGLKLIRCSHIAKLIGAEFASSWIYYLFYFILFFLLLYFQPCNSSICHVANLYVNGVLIVCVCGRGVHYVLCFYLSVRVTTNKKDVEAGAGAACLG